MRGDKILDFVLINLLYMYDENVVYILLLFGFLDYNVVIVCIKKRLFCVGFSRKLILRCDICVSRKVELGWFFLVVDWFILDFVFNIDDCFR